MNKPKRTLPSVLNDAAPAAAATVDTPLKPALPTKGQQHSFYLDRDLEPSLRRAMYNKGINPDTGKRYTKENIFNQAMRQFAESDPDAQRPIPGE